MARGYSNIFRPLWRSVWELQEERCFLDVLVEGYFGDGRLFFWGRVSEASYREQSMFLVREGVAKREILESLGERFWRRS